MRSVCAISLVSDLHFEPIHVVAVNFRGLRHARSSWVAGAAASHGGREYAGQAGHEEEGEQSRHAARMHDGYGWLTRMLWLEVQTQELSKCPSCLHVLFCACAWIVNGFPRADVIPWYPASCNIGTRYLLVGAMFAWWACYAFDCQERMFALRCVRDTHSCGKVVCAHV